MNYNTNDNRRAIMSWIKVEVIIESNGTISIDDNGKPMEIGSLGGRMSPSFDTIKKIADKQIKPKKTSTRTSANTALRRKFASIPLCEDGVNYAMSVEETKSHRLTLGFMFPNEQILFTHFSNAHPKDRNLLKFSVGAGIGDRKYDCCYATSMSSYKFGTKRSFIAAFVVKGVPPHIVSSDEEVRVGLFYGKMSERGDVDLRRIDPTDRMYKNENGNEAINKTMVYSAVGKALKGIMADNPTDDKCKWKQRAMK